MKANETAILLIEFQNEFCSPEGVLFSAVKGELSRQRTIQNTIDLVQKARKKAIQVIHVPISFSEDYHELGEPAGALKNIVVSKAFRKGTKGAEIIGELKPLPKDIIIEGKRTLCAFASTNLDFVLRSKGITHIALCGLLTNICVESTARTAYDRGYMVTIVRDCTCAISAEEQSFAEQKVFPAIASVVTHDEFLAQVQ